MVAPLKRGYDANGKTQAEKLVEGLDALFKQEERLELVYSLEDLISASSNSFYFKDVSHRTLSRYNENGSLSSNYLSMQIPGTEPVGGSPWGKWDAPSAGEESMVAAQEQAEWPNYGFGESEANQMFEDLFPSDTQNSSSSQEAGQAVIDASLGSGYETQDPSSGTPGFPKDGMRINGKNGDFVVSLADFKNPSGGFNVRRADSNTPLNPQPIKRFNNAYAAVRKAHGSGKLDAKFGNKNKYSVSRQERRNLLKGADKALKSREKAVKKGAQQRARQKWVNDKKDFINNIPNNAKDAAGRGLKRLGEAAADFGTDVKAYAEIIAFPAMKEKAKELGQKVLEGMDVLANYQNEFSAKVQKEWPKVRAQIERGVEFAKPHLQNIALDLANQAEMLVQNGVAGYEAAKQWAKEKYPIVQGLIEQAKIKGTPAFNAAKGKLDAITSKVLIGAGKAYEAGRSVQNAAMGFMDRVKGEFNEGRRQAIEARFGKQPRGEFYEQNGAQAYWEKRGDLATEMAQAKNAYEKGADKIGRTDYPDKKVMGTDGKMRIATDADGNLMSGENQRRAALDALGKEYTKASKSVEQGALEIGSSLEAVKDHVQKISDPRNTTSLPPAAGWPSAYGGNNKVRQLQKNLKIAGLQPYKGTIRAFPDIVEHELERGEEQGDGEQGGGEEQPPSGQPALSPGQDGEQPALGPGQDGGEQPALPPGQDAGAPALAAGEQQQAAIPGVGLPGVGLPGGQQEEQALAGGQLAPQTSGGGGGGGGDTADREYLKPGEQGPPGVKVQQGESRGEDGKQSRYYLRSEAKQNRAQGQQNSAQAGPESGGKGDLLNTQGQTVGQVDAVVKQQSNEYANGGPEMANNNGMAEEQPQDDYKAMIARAVEAAKQEQEESKVRMAKAGARRAVAKAGEAEAKAEEAEKEAESNIAGILSKLDSGIATLTAHSDPKVSKILSKLSNDIDNLGKKKTTKK